MVLGQGLLGQHITVKMPRTALGSQKGTVDDGKGGIELVKLIVGRARLFVIVF